ncbi:CRISPR-associated endonuclease Cas2 [soil metagenome]
MRRRYLVAYDICHPKRLRRVCKTMEGYGERLQYSVFVCDLNGMELVGMKTDVSIEMDFGEDSVVIIDLGEPGVGRPIEFLGWHRQLPRAGPRIV